MRILIVLAACSAPPAPVIGHAAARSTRELTGYPTVVEPAEVGCTLDGAWEYGQPDTLRFRDGGPVFATVIEPKHAHLELAGQAAFVAVETTGVRVWGFVDHSGVTLHAGRAFVIADYLIPGPHATLRAVDVTSHDITVAIPPPSYMKVVTSPRGTRACGDLSLTEVRFDPRAAIGDAHQSRDALVAGVSIPLSTVVDAPAVAELHFDEDEPVDVLERRGKLARVVLDTYGDPGADTYVVGWVPQAMLVPDASGHAISDARGGGRGGYRGRPRGGHPVRCQREVPWVVELGGERHLVGAIAPGVVISEIAAAGDFVEVTVERGGVQLAEGARSLVKREAVQACEAVPTATE